MRFLQMLWRRYTLLCTLVITSLPLIIIGWAGRSGLYSEYELTPLTKPALALVMEGIHDGVYPWQSLIGPEEEVEEADEAVVSMLITRAAVYGLSASDGEYQELR